MASQRGTRHHQSTSAIYVGKVRRGPIPERKLRGYIRPNDPRATRENSHDNKTKFVSQENAARAVMKAHATGRLHTYAYPCGFCQGYHIGHLIERPREEPVHG